MSRFKQRLRQRLRNPEIAAGFAARPYVARKPLPDTLSYAPQVIHMNWRRVAFLLPSFVLVLTCISVIVSTLKPGTSWLGATFAFLLLLGILALPILVVRSIKIELAEDRIRQRDLPFSKRDMPYSAIRSIKIDRRTIPTYRGKSYVDFFVIEDKRGATMRIDMVQFRRKDLRTIINTILTHVPYIRVDPSVRAFLTRRSMFW